MTTQTKHRSITLTGRAPVRILEDEWPIIAQAKGDSYSGGDYSRHQQALGQGECDTYSLRVRLHQDGRAIVYGIVNAANAAWGQPQAGESWRGGDLVPAGGDLAAAIGRVGEYAMPESVVRECLADLPAEEI